MSDVCVVRWVGVTILDRIESRWCIAVYIVVSLRWRSEEEGGALGISGERRNGDDED